MRQFVLFIKGILMGLADVVPGVSGGTIAFVLGIYPAFIGALSSINFRWIYFCALYVFSGFNHEYLEKASVYFRAIHWRFLIVLLGGMGCALLLGASFIPTLMARHPTLMRSFFFGLVLASIAVPWAALQHRSYRTFALLIVSAVAIFMLLGARGAPPVRWFQIESTRPQKLLDVSLDHPNLSDPSTIYCPSQHAHNDNVTLRKAMRTQDPETARRLDALCAQIQQANGDPYALSQLWMYQGLSQPESNPYAQLVVPQNTEIWLARPTFWYTFLVGAITICAMVLPGISGSFILLILGAYTFIFASIHDAQQWLSSPGSGGTSLLYVFIFGLGVLAGVMAFSKVVTWLFDHYNDETLATLIGIMIGSLRVLWPFQIGSMMRGITVNVGPSPSDPILACLGLCLAGFVLVVGLARASRAIERKQQTPA